MDVRKLSRVDLNLLVTFHVLFENRHVTRAADQLGISQPALSHSLKRLRETLADPLFVKTPKGMIPTERAQKLAPIIASWLSDIDQTLLSAKDWSLSTAKRTFRIQSTDLIERLLLPSLITALEKDAQKTSVAFTTSQFSLPKEELESGTTDLAIAGFFDELPPGFYRQRVFSDVFQGAVRANHPRFRKKARISVEDLCAENHLIIAPGGSLSGQLDREFEKLGHSRRIVAGLSTFMSAGSILAETDAVLIGPSKMFQSFASSLNLKTFRLPIPLRPLQVVQVWHERNHKDAHHRWLRDQVKQILEK